MQFLLFLFLVFCVFSGCFMCSVYNTKVTTCTYSPTNKITGGAIYGGGFFDWFRGLFTTPKKYSPLKAERNNIPQYEFTINPGKKLIEKSDKMPETIPETVTTHGKTYKTFDCKDTNYDVTSAKCLFCRSPIWCRSDTAYRTDDLENVIHWSCYKNYLGSHTDTSNDYPDIKFKNEIFYAMKEKSFSTGAVCNLCYVILPNEYIDLYQCKSDYYHIDCIKKIMTIPELNKPDIYFNHSDYTVRQHPNTYKKKRNQPNIEKNQCIQCNKIIEDNFYYSKNDNSAFGNAGLHLRCLRPYIENLHTLGQRGILYKHGQILCDNYVNHNDKEDRVINVNESWYYNMGEDKDYHPGCKPNPSTIELTYGIRKINKIIKCRKCKKNINLEDNWYSNKYDDYDIYNYHPECYKKYIDKLFSNE